MDGEVKLDSLGSLTGRQRHGFIKVEKSGSPLC